MSACGFCGTLADAGDVRSVGKRRARLDLAPRTCADCATLEPERPGAALRAAARVLGTAEGDPFLEEALVAEAGALDGLLFQDPGDPLGSAVGPPRRESWSHVPEATREAMRRAETRAIELRALADKGRAEPLEASPPSGPDGCLLCGAGESARWRRVLTSALTSGPDLVEGHLCRVCSVAYDRVGAVGPTLVERAYLDAAGIAWLAGLRFPAVRPWIATGLPPGDPWAWVAESGCEARYPAAEELAAQVAELRAEVGLLRQRALR